MPTPLKRLETVAGAQGRCRSVHPKAEVGIDNEPNRCKVRAWIPNRWLGSRDSVFQTNTDMQHMAHWCKVSDEQRFALRYSMNTS